MIILVSGFRKEEAIVKVDQGGAEISHSSAGNYLIYQDQEKFDLFHVLGSTSTSNYGEHTEYDLSIAKEDGKTVFKLTQDNGFSAEYSQASELRIDLSRTLGKQIHPSGLLSVYFLFNTSITTFCQ